MHPQVLKTGIPRASLEHDQRNDATDDNIQLVKDLGLVASGPGGLEIANPIYREIIPRALKLGRRPTAPGWPS